jgi:hypothetical protein
MLLFTTSRLEEEAIQSALEKRSLAIQSKSARLRSDCAKAVAEEREAKRYHGSVAPSILFSYFSYVPPSPVKSDSKAPKRGQQRPQKMRSK